MMRNILGRQPQSYFCGEDNMEKLLAGTGCKATDVNTHDKTATIECSVPTLSSIMSNSENQTVTLKDWSYAACSKAKLGEATIDGGGQPLIVCEEYCGPWKGSSFTESCRGCNVTINGLQSDSPVTLQCDSCDGKCVQNPITKVQKCDYNTHINAFGCSSGGVENSQGQLKCTHCS